MGRVGGEGDVHGDGHLVPGRDHEADEVVAVRDEAEGERSGDGFGGPVGGAWGVGSRHCGYLWNVVVRM